MTEEDLREIERRAPDDTTAKLVAEVRALQHRNAKLQEYLDKEHTALIEALAEIRKLKRP